MATRLRPSDLWSSVFLLALCVSIPTALLTAPGAGGSAAGDAALNAASLMADDGFYYLRIAENLAGGRGSTFDTVHPTNGYHPLWLFLLVPIQWLADSGETALLLTLALQVLLVAGTALCLYRFARIAMAPGGSLVCVFIWLVIQCGYWPSLSGMEFALQSFLIALLLIEMKRVVGTGPASAAVGLRLGGLLGLAFLARLDNGLLGALILLFLAKAAPHLRRQILIAGAVLAAVGLSYAAINGSLFGSFVPISGVLKRDWSLELLTQDLVYQAHGWLAAKLSYLGWPTEHWPGTEVLLFALGTLGPGGALIAGRLVPKPRLFLEPIQRALEPFAMFALLQVAFYVVLYHGGYSFQPWYFAVQGLLAGLTAGATVEAARRWLESRRPGRSTRIAAELLVASLLVTLSVRIAWSGEQRRESLGGFTGSPLYSAALWLDEHLPPATRVGAWNAGILSHFSDVRVINLDGLVNSVDFRHRRRDLCRYWREEEIDYLADVFDRQAPFALFADQASGCLDSLELIWSGPSYPGSGRGSAVYRIAGEGEGE